MQAVILALCLCASVDPPSITLHPLRSSAVIGRDGQVRLELRAEGVGTSQGLPTFATNVGYVEQPRQISPGIFHATYRLPDGGLPAIAVIVAALDTPEGTHYAAARIRLYAEAAIALKTVPGARVDLWALGQHHGPKFTNSSGRVSFAVRTLGLRFAYRYRIKVRGAKPVERSERVMRDGQLSRLTIGPIPAAGVVKRGDTIVFAAAVATEDGHVAPAASIRCAVAGGEMAPSLEIAGDVAVFRATVPRRADSVIKIRCRCSDGARARRNVVLRSESLGGGVHLTVDAPTTFRAGDDFPRVVVRAMTGDDTLLPLPRDLQLRATLEGGRASGPREVPLASIQDRERQIMEVLVQIPSHFAGAKAVRFTASAKNGTLKNEKHVLLRAGAPAKMRVTGPPGPFAASGKQVLSLWVELVDEYGNTAPGRLQASAELGTAKTGMEHRVDYTAPLLVRPQNDIVSIRSGRLQQERSIALVPPRLLSIEGGAGLFATDSGSVAPVVVLNVAYRHERISGMLSLGAVEGFSGKEHHPEVAEGVTARTDWSAYLGTGKALYDLSIAQWLGLRFGVGLGVTLFATELELRTAGKLERPRTRQWAPAVHVATASSLVFCFGHFGATVNVDIAGAMPLDGSPVMLTLLGSVAFVYLWGMP